MSDMNDKVALITGASSGIGWATGEAFAARGAKVVLAARREDQLAALARDILERREGQLRRHGCCHRKGRRADGGTHNRDIWTARLRGEQRRLRGAARKHCGSYRGDVGSSFRHQPEGHLLVFAA